MIDAFKMNTEASHRVEKSVNWIKEEKSAAQNKGTPEKRSGHTDTHKLELCTMLMSYRWI